MITVDAKSRQSRREECGLEIPNEREPAPRAQRVYWVRATTSGDFWHQPEGLVLFFRPASLSLVYVESLHFTRSVSLDEKKASSSGHSISVNRP